MIPKGKEEQVIAGEIDATKLVDVAMPETPTPAVVSTYFFFGNGVSVSCENSLLIL